MSGYSEMYRDQQQAKWLDRWVPADDEKLGECPVKFREQYRFTLARAREAEAQVKEYREIFRRFKNVMEA